MGVRGKTRHRVKKSAVLMTRYDCQSAAVQLYELMDKQGVGGEWEEKSRDEDKKIKNYLLESFWSSSSRSGHLRWRRRRRTPTLMIEARLWYFPTEGIGFTCYLWVRHTAKQQQPGISVESCWTGEEDRDNDSNQHFILVISGYQRGEIRNEDVFERSAPVSSSPNINIVTRKEEEE